ncbi:unnamed protein product, partial [Meganyctiphanes norvegica]
MQQRKKCWFKHLKLCETHVKFRDCNAESTLCPFYHSVICRNNMRMERCNYGNIYKFSHINKNESINIENLTRQKRNRNYGDHNEFRRIEYNKEQNQHLDNKYKENPNNYYNRNINRNWQNGNRNGERYNERNQQYNKYLLTNQPFNNNWNKDKSKWNQDRHKYNRYNRMGHQALLERYLKQQETYKQMGMIMEEMAKIMHRQTFDLEKMEKKSKDEKQPSKKLYQNIRRLVTKTRKHKKIFDEYS